ncbi:enoyl-CoA hydratase [Limnobacter humi]|uniref:Enoyl-CoA hydratase n=1 Tax=Limnobacter humi TaxID=1778671 RepID=A0ABT1WCH1_9BURK|nr:enoyl-CoA hydratase [Limnobacter humi]MCQ8895217.1 enoyl-CoA hydratase [Limnobacter humi]
MDIQTSIDSGLMTITINRPERKNSFTNAMYTAIGDAFAQASHNAAVKVVLLKGHEDCFSAGNDLGDFVNNPPKNLDAPVFRFLRLISAFPKPVVAQVQGVAVGIGTTVLLHCDLVYAASTAKFSMPFTKLGLCPEASSSLLLPQLAGYQKAAELLLLGDMFTATKACECGIVSSVHEPAELPAHVQGQINKLLALPLSSLLTSKRLMKGVNKAPVAAKMAEEGELFINMLKQPVAQEAFKAFAEKRAPNFAQFEQHSK